MMPVSAYPPVGAVASLSEEHDFAPLREDRVRVYLNNAATTWPKPDPVVSAVERSMRGHGSAMRQDGGGGGDLIGDCRRRIAAFFNVPDPSRLMLLPGCTYALNLGLFGLPWQEGDVIVISGLEHHAVSRPARKIAERHGVRLEVSPYAPGRPFDLDWLESILKQGRVRLVATTMASNITGEVLPTKSIIDLAQRFEALTLVDAAQAAGVRPVDVTALGCDMIAFAGHKGLYGPLGVGGLWVSERIQLDTLAEGGTGGDSGKHALSGSYPSTFEVGSHNLPAIAGLDAGVAWLESVGVDVVQAYEHRITESLRSELAQVSGVRVWGGEPGEGRTGAVSITVEGVEPKQVAGYLADRHGIACRAGFHCAPLAHETIGTLALKGTARMSPGFFNTEEDIEIAVSAVRDFTA